MSFTLTSLDHNEVLLSSNVHSSRHLLGEGEIVIPPTKLKLEFQVNGNKYESILNRETGAVKPGTKITLGKENGVREVIDAHETFAFYSEDRKWIMTFHNHNKVDGLIVNEETNEVSHFSAENGVFTLNDKLSSVLPERHLEEQGTHLRKLVEQTEEKRRLTMDYWPNCHSAQSSGLSGIDVGFAIGNNFYDRFGTVESTNLINSYVVNSNLIYENQMDISLQIDDIFVATSLDAAPWTSDNCRRGIQRQLSAMRTWDKPSVQPLWHLMDDCLSLLGILGIAYIAGLCEDDINVGVSYYSEDLDPIDYPTWGTVAHEIGHNFNAQHSFEEGQGNTGGIMDYGPMEDKRIDGTYQFNTQYRQREVCFEVQDSVDRGCVNIGETKSEEETEILFAELGKTTEIVSDCVRKLHKAPTTNDHIFIARSGYTQAQCDALCGSRTDCTSYVFSEKNGHCELFSFLSDSETVFSPFFDTYICGPAARNVVPAEDDLLAEAPIEDFQEQCCTLKENKHVDGLNRWIEREITKEQCFSNCVSSTGCEAASWDMSIDTCLYFGGADYTNEVYNMEGAYSIQCSSECITDRVFNGVTNEENSSVGVSLAVVGGLVAAVVGIGAVYKFTSRKKADRAKPITAPQSL